MAFHEIKVPDNAPITQKLLAWVDSRFPLSSTIKAHLTGYYAPKNLNFWYVFGALSIVVLANQIITGIFLTMNYKPDAAKAFESVEYIMREVPFGWLIRYMHSTGASMFFIVVYLHMFRGMIYGSYRKPRELIWIFGTAIFLCLMGEAFFGYLLPWGQMSYWGAQVIVNLFSAIPLIGPDLSLWLRGDYVVGDATLNRFFAFHVIAIPLVLVGLVAAHIVALHEVGSNNPDGIEIKDTLDADGHPVDGVPFHPFYTVHDVMALSIFLIIFALIIFFAPEMGGYFIEANNFIPANPFQTPAHIAPVWYFTPFYSMLRGTTTSFLIPLWIFFAVILGMSMVRAKTLIMKALCVFILAALAVGFYLLDAKFWGVVIMGGSVVVIFFLPWLDQSKVKSIRYRPNFHKYIYGVFVVSFIILGYLGIQPPSPVFEKISQICTIYYLGFFLAMPFWSQLGQFKPVPSRVTFQPH
ncbi:cytochrome bc complex cytochrome b subunit [Polynucleobacter sp. IMCC30063]|uniref:cytochrome b n=1 Tax=unclassified Polynucleobacter TaxID=2640945 RepID=UPI001F1E614A|nr:MULTISPECIES: cytochrome bc complex cytochrome b subunit [unclassified Polynucleobacter]MCE7505004.1 cytochrome bc complex cytochrome b subunit [Polynucleobacter sp. IMCC30063]MCE7526204.1 cytochrome bc complex cytochrome b subunit [Polynucleobacter sp. IMCC 30228]MCE7528510.1 cytochrome bc complex cytochrome b subunit [Polynucleobacter sp. IMCC 29146]